MSLRVVALIAAFNEDDVIGQVIADLVSQGVEVHLIDHGSTDHTVEAARPYLGHGLLAIERFPEQSGLPPETGERFAWRALLRRKQRLAVELEADWFLHQDADELRETPWDGVGLAEGIRRVDALGYNAVDFRTLDFVPVNDGFRPGADLRRTFSHYRRPASYDRLRINAWRKLDGVEVDLESSGGHEAVFPGRRVFPTRFLLRHYPIRSQSHGERKVFSERLPRYPEDERAGGWHLQYDGVVPGTSFLGDPSALREFDPAVVRAELLEENRDLEALRRKLTAWEADGERIAADLAWYRREWPRREAELLRALAERDASARHNVELREHAANLEAASAALEARVAALGRHAANLEAIAAATEDAYRASFSWRLTGPLRALVRLVRGH